jgi:hypothetical protein
MMIFVIRSFNIRNPDAFKLDFTPKITERQDERKNN